ncbi:MAG: HAD family phosphatase [Bacteroidales bacterium]|nr:HAD family phosphatase [Bacteroidales bacterium]
MIKNLIFDFGKVLVTYDFHSPLDAWGMTPRERQDFEDSILSMEWTLKIDKGEKSFGEYIEELKGLYPHIAKYFQRVYDEYAGFITGEMPGMYDLLTRLKADGYKLYGLTNWSETIYQFLDKYLVFRLLDGMVISSEEKMIKPDLEIYYRICEKFGLKPEECLFTDDKPVNVEAAKQMGMQGIVFRNALQFEEELAPFLGAV